MDPAGCSKAIAVLLLLDRGDPASASRLALTSDQLDRLLRYPQIEV
jgi:hypothetical protein